MIELIAAALLQLAVITSDGTIAVPATEATAAATTTATADGGAGNWDDGNRN